MSIRRLILFSTFLFFKISILNSIIFSYFSIGTNDQLIVALKSEEKDGVAVGSYITVFSIDGTIILDETPLLGQYKFEGIEFV